MLTRITGLAVAALLAGANAQAAPQAQSALECGIAADMAVVAHSLAKEKIDRPKADAIMARIYNVAETERGQQLMHDILAAAYVNKGPSSQKFAEDLFSVCMARGGNMDPILGHRL